MLRRGVRWPRASSARRPRSRARWADVGCAAGQALIKLAQTYPRSSLAGYDTFQGAIDPVGLLRAIRRALEPGGTYLMLEMRCADDPAENLGPFGTLLYGISVLYCMSTSLAHGGAGLGTCGCPPEKVHELCAQAGFSRIRQLPLENPSNVLYEITP